LSFVFPFSRGKRKEEESKRVAGLEGRRKERREGEVEKVEKVENVENVGVERRINGVAARKGRDSCPSAVPSFAPLSLSLSLSHTHTQTRKLKTQGNKRERGGIGCYMCKSTLRLVLDALVPIYLFLFYFLSFY
jgi:hypothetical protein